MASRLEQLAEVLEDGVTARLVEPGDPEALARAIEGLFDHPAEAEELGRRARLEAERSHTWDLRAQTILDVLAGASAS